MLQPWKVGESVEYGNGLLATVNQVWPDGAAILEQEGRFIGAWRSESEDGEEWLWFLGDEEFGDLAKAVSDVEESQRGQHQSSAA